MKRTTAQPQLLQTIELDGLEFRVQVEHDAHMCEPWNEHDGHGVVSDWTSRAKRPGEKILAQDHGHYRYYDIAATAVIARKDGWGVADTTGSKAQIVAEAIARDYEHLRAWCADEWQWVYVSVDLLDADGNPVHSPDAHESLGGIESSDVAYINETARELAEEIAARYAGCDEIQVRIRTNEEEI